MSDDWKNCKGEEAPPTLFKKILMVAVPLLSLGLLVRFVYQIQEYVTVDPGQWSIFFNASIPKSFLGIAVVLLPVILFDLGYQGHTIRTLLHIHCCSSDGDKWRALVFLFAIGFLCLIAVKGTFLFT